LRGVNYGLDQVAIPKRTGGAHSFDIIFAFFILQSKIRDLGQEAGRASSCFTSPRPWRSLQESSGG